MNEAPAFRAEPQSPTSDACAVPKALVWDAPVRIFHWLMAFCFAGAYLTAESERWRLLHVTFGYTMIGLVAFRILWGLIGTRPARFKNFLRGPSAVKRYLQSILSRRPEHHVGHNPAGAWAIVGLLALTLMVGATGWAAYNSVGGESLEGAHELLANTMLALVGLHIAGVVVSSWIHRENLVGTMISGRKSAEPGSGIRTAHYSVAGLMIAAVLAFWILQWQSAPATGGANSRDHSFSHVKHGDQDKDD